jgi:hypothetical protein
LRRAAGQAEDERKVRTDNLRAFLESLPAHVDLDVLASDDMWQ